VSTRTTKCPTQNSRIVNGCKVEITGGQFKGRVGKALLLTGSMWFVDVEGTKVTLHRTCLKRVVEGQVAA
jgi:ribosomal protein L24